MKPWINLLVIVAAALAISNCSPSIGGKSIGFKSLDGRSKSLSGILSLPKAGNKPFPAVVLVHGTAGPDDRYDFHRSALLGAGIATFQVDFKSGIFTGPSDRPRTNTFVPFAYGALRALRANPAIDPDRIAIMGFSLGGALTVHLTGSNYREDLLEEKEKGFVGHVAFYPSCKHQTVPYSVTGAPLLILAGEKDSYGDGEACGPWIAQFENFNPGLATLKLYPGVHHGFDGKKSWTERDPAAINQTAVLEPNSEAAEDARQRAVMFLKKVFGMMGG